MKKYKKLGYFAGLLAFFTLLILPFWRGGIVQAQTGDDSSLKYPDVQQCINSLKFKSRVEITCTTTAQGEVSFVDAGPEDSDYNYKPTSDVFCTTGDTVAGIELDSGNPFNGKAKWVDLDYWDPAVSPHCQNTKPDKAPNVSIANAAAAQITYQWNGSDLVSLIDGNTLSQLGPTNPDIYILSATEACGGGQVVVTKDDTSGTEYKLSRAGLPKQELTGPLAAAFSDTCYVLDKSDIKITGTKGQPATGQPTRATTESASSDCVTNSNIGLEWLLCPITTALGKAVDGFNALISSQLHFDVDQNLADDGGVHKAWTIFKNLIAVVLVIIMLVMVISQAVGGGPFEAYTVRKMLPRLVIAVVGIQISWELTKWLIGLANDLGDGIKQLMLAPFGGGGNMDLNSILHHLSPDWALGSQVLIPTILVSAAIIGAVALPGTLVLAVTLFIGALMALAMLLFRNVLIVALVLFAPVALLLWILPNQGMQKYWKLWSDNFIKLLLLFPLMIAIIYTGRIMAWIIADTNRGHHIGLIDWLALLVAFFGPYFIIFKAYQWGGGIYGAAGSALSNVKGGLMKHTSPILRTLGERAQGNLADKYAIKSAKQREARAALERAQAMGASQGVQDRHQKRIDDLEKRDKFRRAMLRIGSGQPLPFQRGQIETLAKATAYKEDLVNKKRGLIHQDFVEELNRNGGDVQGAKAYVLKKYGSQSWQTRPDGGVITDRHGNPALKDNYTERAMQNWYVDTKSAMELGNEEWRRGAITDDSQELKPSAFMAGGSHNRLNPTNNPEVAQAMADRSKIVGYWSDPSLSRDDILMGKKPNFDMAKTNGFMGMMNADPNRYAYIAEKLPTLQPFNQELGGGPKREDYRPAVVDAAGAVVTTGGAKAPTEAVVSLADYMPGGAHAHLNQAHTAARAQELATEEAERRGMLLADDARYVKWQTNMESPTQYATVRPEEYQVMSSIKEDLEEIGLKSEAAEKLHVTLEELADSQGVEGKSIIQRMTGGEKSARGAVNKMFGTEYLEGKLQIPSKNPIIKEVETEHTIGRIAALPRETQLIADVPLAPNRPLPRAEFKKEVLKDVDRAGRTNKGIAREFVQTLAEPPEYAQAAHGTSKELYLEAFNELDRDVGANQVDRAAFNKLIDGIAEQIKRRADREIKAAAANANLTDAQRVNIAANVRAETEAEIAAYEARRKPGADPDQGAAAHPPGTRWEPQADGGVLYIRPEDRGR